MCSESNPHFCIRTNWIRFFKVLYSSAKQRTVPFSQAGAAVFAQLRVPVPYTLQKVAWGEHWAHPAEHVQ